MRALVPALRHLDRAVSDEERLAQIRALEELKAATAAAQAKIAVDYATSQSQNAKPGEIKARLAVARRESPHAGGRFLRLAQALVSEMPCTLTAIERGRLSEYRASIVVRETGCLTSDDRSHVDSTVCADIERVATLGNRQLDAEVKTASYRTAPEVVVQRAAYAVTERRVSLRPAPDTMVWLTALLPVAQGVAAYASLGNAADSGRAAGDERSRGQVMADTLVERLTGHATADAVPVEVNLIMTDRTLLAGDGEPAHLVGYGAVPGRTARDLVAAGSNFWLRRLYTHPTSGQLVATDSRSRAFPAGLAKLITLRDQHCRTPWCDAPIRHVDHVQPHDRGGPTSLVNGQGLCECCNLTKADSESWPGSDPPDPPGFIRPAMPPPMILEIYEPPFTLIV